MMMTPDHHLGATMTCQIVPDQYQANRRPSEVLSIRVGIAPIAPVPSPLLSLGLRQLGQCGQDLGQLVLEPGMQHRVGGMFDRKRAHLSGRGVKQGEQLGGSAPDIFRGPMGRFRFRLPGGSRLRDGLIGTGFIFGPDGDVRRFA
jgi:hypothetical protein